MQIGLPMTEQTKNITLSNETLNHNRKTLARVTFASQVGTTLEFYDHFIYGTAAALVFPKVFFVQNTPAIALLLSLVTYGIAYAARPLGALIFGHFGDRIGRKNMLVLALLIMGLATFLIGVLPSYSTAGVLGGILLCILRLMQGIALGGEWGGAALMVAEYAKDSKYRAFLGSMVQLSAPIGFLMASGVFAIISYFTSEEQFFSWGWRIPFLASAVLLVVGLYIRKTIEESPEFIKNQKYTPKHQKAPISILIKNHWKTLLLAIGTRIGSDAAFYVFALFLQIYLPMRGLPKSLALQASIVASIGQIAGIPIFGHLADKHSTRSVMAVGAVLNIIWAFVFFQLVDTMNPTIILFASFMALFILATMWSPLAAHYPAMFPVEIRFTGAGVGYQTASIFGGAIAPTICYALVSTYNSTLPISFYLAAILLIGFICILLTPTHPKNRTDLHNT